SLDPMLLGCGSGPTRRRWIVARRPTFPRPTIWHMTPSTVDTFASEVLAIEVDGHVATLWLDRPEKRNAMGPAFWSDLPLAMAAIGSEPEIRAVVVAARGPHFSVGLDLVAMSGLTGPGRDPPPAGIGELGRRVRVAGHRRHPRLLHRRRRGPGGGFRHPAGQRGRHLLR